MAKKGKDLTVNESRVLALFNFTRDYSFGTLWWISELYWRTHIPSFASDRNKHPGFSICRKKSTDFSPCIPILFGSSSCCSRGFFVTGVSSQYPKNHRTWFGGIEKPVLAVPCDFYGEESPIEINSHKYRASADEIASAEKYLERQNQRCRKKQQRRRVK